MSAEDIFKYLVKECHLTPAQIAGLNDLQIRVLCSKDKGMDDLKNPPEEY